MNRNGNPENNGEGDANGEVTDFPAIKVGLTVGKWPSRFSAGGHNRRRRSSTSGNIYRSGAHPAYAATCELPRSPNLTTSALSFSCALLQQLYCVC